MSTPALSRDERDKLIVQSLMMKAESLRFAISAERVNPDSNDEQKAATIELLQSELAGCAELAKDISESIK